MNGYRIWKQAYFVLFLGDLRKFTKNVYGLSLEVCK